MPIAASRLIAPVEIAPTRTCGVSAPIRMMDPFPHVFSICVIARFSALRRSSVSEGEEDLAGCCSAMVDLDIRWRASLGGDPNIDRNYSHRHPGRKASSGGANVLFTIEIQSK